MRMFFVNLFGIYILICSKQITGRLKNSKSTSDGLVCLTFIQFARQSVADTLNQDNE